MLFAATLEPLLSDTELSRLAFHDIARFVRLCQLLKPRIEFSMYNRSQPPLHLPDAMEQFLSLATTLPCSTVKKLWSALHSTVWESKDKLEASEEEVSLFLVHGLTLGIGESDCLSACAVLLHVLQDTEIFYPHFGRAVYRDAKIIALTTT